MKTYQRYIKYGGEFIKDKIIEKDPLRKFGKKIINEYDIKNENELYNYSYNLLLSNVK